MSKPIRLTLILLVFFLGYRLLILSENSDSSSSSSQNPRSQKELALKSVGHDSSNLTPQDSKSGASRTPQLNSIEAKTVNLPNFANPQFRPDFVRGSFPDGQQNIEIDKQLSSTADLKPGSLDQRDLATEVQNTPTPSDNESLFTPEELALLQQPQQTSSQRNRNLIGGPPRKRTTTNAVSPATKIDTAEQPEQDSSEQELPRVSGQIRGYQLLNLMHPSARSMVEQTIRILLASQIQDIYLGVLTDGTFGWDPNYLTDVINRLSTDERRLTLALYLTNGSTMRSYDTTDINAGFNTMEPSEFRSRIKFDPATRSRYVELVQRVRPIFVFNSSLHPDNRNIAVPMLEDNLDYDSYLAIRELTKAVLGNGVQYIRNPCPSCYEGNDLESGGDSREFHGIRDYSLTEPGDGLTLDGTGFFHSFESPAPNELNVSELLNLMEFGRQRRLYYFALWRFDRQGINPGQPLVHPDRRTFIIPSEAHVRAEIDILRHGLNPVEDFPSGDTQEPPN